MTPEALLYVNESPRILVADVASGTLQPAAHPDWLVLSSGHAPWRDSVLVEQYRRPPFEGSAHYLQDHILYAALDKTFFFDLLDTVWGSPMTETARNV